MSPGLDETPVTGLEIRSRQPTHFVATRREPLPKLYGGLFILAGGFLLILVGFLTLILFGVIPGETSREGPDVGAFLILPFLWISFWLLGRGLFLCVGTEEWAIQNVELRITWRIWGVVKTRVFPSEHFSLQESAAPGVWMIWAKTSPTSRKQLIYAGTDGASVFRLLQKSRSTSGLSGLIDAHQ
jgi:hypothetical protein